MPAFANSPGIRRNIRWAILVGLIPPDTVRSSALAQILNREMEEISITVMPTPSAAASVRGFAGGQFDGYYGADVAFVEIANDAGR